MKRDDLLGLARLAVQIARTQMPDDANKFAPKRYTQPSLLACLVPEGVSAPGLSEL